MSAKPPDPDRKARLAEALRANLQRRKQQARQRSGTSPAGKPPQSPGTPEPSR
jgi:hypothetical protein